MNRHLVLRVISKMLLGPIILFAFYVQFHGDFGPGGGFQAGVILGAAIILYGIVFGLDEAEAAIPPAAVRLFMALGVLLYAGVGVAGLFLGGNYLNYNVLDSHDPAHGQHLGIILVELGVLFTVSSTMIAIFYSFAGRPPAMSDEDW